jgi:hypothetical protein
MLGQIGASLRGGLADVQTCLESAFISSGLRRFSQRWKPAFAAIVTAALILPVPAYATLNFAATSGNLWTLNDSTGKGFFTITGETRSGPSSPGAGDSFTELDLSFNAGSSTKFSGTLTLTTQAGGITGANGDVIGASIDQLIPNSSVKSGSYTLQATATGVVGSPNNMFVNPIPTPQGNKGGDFNPLDGSTPPVVTVTFTFTNFQFNHSSSAARIILFDNTP